MNLRKIVKEVLNENPDTVYIYDEDGEEKEMLSFDDSDAMAFTIIYPLGEDKFRIDDLDEDNFEVYVARRPAHTHGDIKRDYREKYAKDYPRGVRYDGRLWMDHNIVSFWDYPKPSLLRTSLPVVVDKINKQQNRNLDLKDFQIEVDDGEFKDLTDYAGTSFAYARVDHEKSPLLKKQRTKPPYDVYKDLKTEPARWRHAVERGVAEALNESPDGLYLDDGTPLRFNDYDAVPFMIFDMGKDFEVFVGSFRDTHTDMEHDYFEVKEFPSEKQYDGRIWVDRGVISFWNYPERDLLKRMFPVVLEKVNKRHNTNLRMEDLVIEHPMSEELVDLKTYLAYDKKPEWEEEIEDIKRDRIDHEKSPLLKKQKGVLYDKYKDLKIEPVKWRHAYERGVAENEDMEGERNKENMLFYEIYQQIKKMVEK